MAACDKHHEKSTSERKDQINIELTEMKKENKADYFAYEPNWPRILDQGTSPVEFHKDSSIKLEYFAEDFEKQRKMELGSNLPFKSLNQSTNLDILAEVSEKAMKIEIGSSTSNSVKSVEFGSKYADNEYLKPRTMQHKYLAYEYEKTRRKEQGNFIDKSEKPLKIQHRCLPNKTLNFNTTEEVLLTDGSPEPVVTELEYIENENKNTMERECLVRESQKIIDHNSLTIGSEKSSVARHVANVEAAFHCWTCKKPFNDRFAVSEHSMEHTLADARAAAAAALENSAKKH